jgi:hypothetical protein
MPPSTTANKTAATKITAGKRKTAAATPKVATSKSGVSHPARSSQVEDWLDGKGFSWVFFPEYPISRIDVEGSLKNQARIGTPLIDSQVEEYVTKMKAGEIFPGIVIAERASATAGLADVVDGNHRVAAWTETRQTKVPAYLISGAKRSEVILATMEVNTRHGRPTAPEERVQQALFYVDNGATAEQASESLSVDVKLVRAAVALREVDRRASSNSLNLGAWSNLPETIRKRLGQISTDSGFKAAAQLAMDAKLSAGEVHQLVNDLAPLRDSDKQEQFVKATRKALAPEMGRRTAGITDAGGKGRSPRTPRQRWNMWRGQGNNLPDAALIVEWIDPTEVPEFVSDVDAVMQRLAALREAALAKAR